MHDGRSAEVDAGLADLIRACWQAGIDTTMSCENIGGRTWVAFADSHAASDFAAAIFGNGDEFGVDALHPASSWWWTVVPMPLEPGCVVIDVDVRFPVSEHDEVLRRVRALRKEEG